MQAIVFCDVTDVWSYLGATRFERAAGMFTIVSGEVVEIVYRAASAPEAPPDDAERAAAAARISAVELRLDERVPADSTDAWRLLTWAAETDTAAGDPELEGLGLMGTTQRDLIHQLWKAHLAEGADLADPLTLTGRAALAGLPLDGAEGLLASTDYAPEVQRQRETAAEIGVTELPTVVIDAGPTLTGLMSQDDYLQALNLIHQRR